MKGKRQEEHLRPGRPCSVGKLVMERRVSKHEFNKVYLGENLLRKYNTMKELSEIIYFLNIKHYLDSKTIL